MNIYIACGLTHVPRSEFTEYVSFIHGLAQHLTITCKACVKYALRDSDPQLAAKPFNEKAKLCYFWDKDMVEWADVVIAECSFPSTGLGIELQIAEGKNIPIIITFQQVDKHRAVHVEYETPDQARHTLQLGDGYVSLMALGMPSVFKVLPYAASHDGYPALAEVIWLLSTYTDSSFVEAKSQVMQNSILQNAEDPVLRHKLELGPEIAHFSWAFMALNILIYWG